MDLDKLFTVTDYQTKVITISLCHDDDDDERPDDGQEDGVCEEHDGSNNKTCEENKAAAATVTTRQQQQRSIEIEIVCSPSASTDYDLTGQILWPVSVLLAHYVALASSTTSTTTSSSSSSSSSSCSTTAISGRKRLVLQGRNVVELGAGTGLPGLVAAACAARNVTLTDGNEIVCDTILKQNIVKFQQKHKDQVLQQLSCQQVVWGNRKHVAQLLKQMNNRVDVVLAADVVQWPAVVEPLLHTVKALLWNAHVTDHHEQQQQQQPPIFLLGIVNRATATYNLFCQLARELGFEYRPIRPEEWWFYLPEGGGGQAAALALSDSCREYGGRETEIYELKLKRQSCTGGGQQQQLEPPVLLQPRRRRDDGNDDDDDDDDYSETVGKSFEHTAFLPC